MTIGRVTQRMLTQNSLDSMQTGLGRLAKVQEQLTTGRIINRPSDDPTGTTAAMRLRSQLASETQYTRNADDAIGWLAQIDSALGTATDVVRRAHQLALEGASGAVGSVARQALAAEVEEIRDGLVSTANTSYLDRPVFGGVTAGAVAYDDTGAYVGTPGDVTRRIADGVVVKVDVDGRTAFGDGATSVFAELDALATALRANDPAAVRATIDTIGARLDTITGVRTSAGARYQRIEQAAISSRDNQLSLNNSLAEVENTDLAKATVDLQMQEIAYQAALAATARVLQPSLVDFLR